MSRLSTLLDTTVSGRNFQGGYIESPDAHGMQKNSVAQFIGKSLSISLDNCDP
jgi:hypothetical protein